MHIFMYLYVGYIYMYEYVLDTVVSIHILKISIDILV